MSRRTDQRRAAAFALYQRDVTGRSLEDVLDRDASTFTRALTYAADDYRDELDAIIGEHAQGWTIDRIAPLVTADLTVTGQWAYIAARLLDVDPATNTETLVARGLYRIDPAAPNGRQTFQLHANGWRFADGHVPKLELLGQDAPYSRPSNTPFTIEVSNLELRLPVHDDPGAPGTSAAVELPR